MALLVVLSFTKPNRIQLKFRQAMIKPIYPIIAALAVFMNPLAALAEAKDITPSKYQVAACKSILEHLLLRPASLQVLGYELLNATKNVYRNPDVNPDYGLFDPAAVIIDYKAKNKDDNFIQERAFCQITSRGTVSIKSAHIRYSSHLDY